MKLPICHELPPELGPPLPPTVAARVKQLVTTSDIAAGLAEVGLVDAAQLCASPTLPTAPEAARSQFVELCAGRRFVHAGHAYAAHELFDIMHDNLVWERTVPDDFKIAWQLFRERIGTKSVVKLCYANKLQSYAYYLNGCGYVAAGPGPKTLPKLEHLERDALYPGLFTRRLRWLLLLRRTALRAPRGPDGLPLQFTPLFHALWTERQVPLHALATEVVDHLHPGTPEAFRTECARSLHLRFHQFLYFDGIPRLNEEAAIAEVDVSLAADGALLRAFHEVKRSLHVQNERPLVEQSQAFLRDFDAFATYKEATPEWLDEHDRNRRSKGWTSPASRIAATAFLSATVREMMLPREQQGLGLPPEEVRLVLMAMYPEKHFLPADRSRLKRQGKTTPDACSQACYRIFRDLLSDGGFYAQTGPDYYADPDIAGQLPKEHFERFMAHLPGTPLHGHEAQWQEQRHLARAAWRAWRKTWRVPKGLSAFARRTEPFLAVVKTIPISVIYLILDEAWTALPSVGTPKERALWIRDLLIVEFLVSKAQRRRTLGQLLRSHFQRIPGEVTYADVPADISKNLREWKGRLTDRLSLALDRYLDESWPVLAGDKEPAALFLTAAGRPLADGNPIYRQVLGATKILFGSRINSHGFRYILATSLLLAGIPPQTVADLMMLHKNTLLRFYRLYVSQLQLQVNTHVWKRIAKGRDLNSGILPTALEGLGELPPPGREESRQNSLRVQLIQRECCEQHRWPCWGK